MEISSDFVILNSNLIRGNVLCAKVHTMAIRGLVFIYVTLKVWLRVYCIVLCLMQLI